MLYNLVVAVIECSELLSFLLPGTYFCDFCIANVRVSEKVGPRYELNVLFARSHF